jgi:hypothetical protein
MDTDLVAVAVIELAIGATLLIGIVWACVAGIRDCLATMRAERARAARAPFRQIWIDAAAAEWRAMGEARDSGDWAARAKHYANYRRYAAKAR